jgi:molecular chaperone GrpE
MTKENKEHESTQIEAAQMAEAAEQSPEPELKAEAGAEPVTVTLPKAEVDLLRQQAQEMKDRILRNQAEFDNVRKRLRKEADEAGVRAIARFVKPIMNELDNFNRALNAAKPEAFAEFAHGVAMTRENLAGALSGAGIETIPCEGVFDPSVHEVIAEVEKADVPRGTIVEIHRAGYKLRDQLVRAAQVVVSKPPTT